MPIHPSVTWRGHWPSPPAVNHGVVPPLVAGVALVAAAEVVARREAGAGAAHDRHPDVVVDVGPAQRVDQAAPQRRG